MPKLITLTGHEISELVGCDVAVSVAVENSKGFSYHFTVVFPEDGLIISVYVQHHLLIHPFHHLAKLAKINCSRAVNVYLINHVQQLLFRWILSQSAHSNTQLFT